MAGLVEAAPGQRDPSRRRCEAGLDVAAGPVVPGQLLVAAHVVGGGRQVAAHQRDHAPRRLEAQPRAAVARRDQRLGPVAPVGGDGVPSGEEPGDGQVDGEGGVVDGHLGRQAPHQPGHADAVALVDELQHGLDEELSRRVPVVEDGEMAVGTVHVAALGQQRRGAPVEGEAVLRSAPAQLALQQLADQALEPHGAVMLVDGDEEQAAALELVGQHVTVGAEQADAQVGVEPLEHRQRQRGVALALGQVVEDLGDEIVGEQAVRADDGLGPPLRIGGAAQGEQREVEADRPSLGVLVEPDHRLVAQLDVLEAGGDGERLVVGEPQVRFADLGDPLGGVPPREGQGRIQRATSTKRSRWPMRSTRKASASKTERSEIVDRSSRTTTASFSLRSMPATRAPRNSGSDGPRSSSSISGSASSSGNTDWRALMTWSQNDAVLRSRRSSATHAAGRRSPSIHWRTATVLP